MAMKHVQWVFWAVAKELFFIQNKTLWTYSCQI